MIKVKDGYAKLIGTTYSGSADRVLLSNGGDKAVSDFAAASALSDYVTLATAQTITGVKTFYGSINSLIIKRNSDSNGSYITFENNSGRLGILGIAANKNIYFYKGTDTSTTFTVLHSGNYTDYTVKKDGTGASGTWEINITGKAAYLPITSGLTTETNITESGLRAYAGSGSGWTGEVTSMTYAGILALGTPSRGFQMWARRGTGNTGSLHFRVGNDDANAWEPERIILDSVNWSSYITSLKNPNALTAFGVTYDGSSAQTVNEQSLINRLLDGTADCTDSTIMLTSYTNGWSGNAGRIYGRPASKMYNYIKGKLDSVYLPLAGGTLSGHLSSNSGYTIVQPYGAQYNATTSSVTGCITVVLPASIGNTMVSMWIDVYVYDKQKSFSVHCGGYTYNNSTWANHPFAMVYGANHRVRMGHNGTNFVIYIGEESTVWSYPQVSVRNVTLGHSPTIANWQKAWDVVFSTSVSNVTYGTTTYVWTTKNLTKSSIDLGNVQNTAFYKRVVTVNGSGWNMAGTTNSDAFTIYAPTTAGTSGQVLTSSEGTPNWTDQSSLSVGIAKSLDYKSLPSSTSNATNTVWCKFARITYNAKAWCNANGYFIFSGGESTDHAGILSYHFRAGSTATTNSIAILEWLVKNRDTATVIAEKVEDNVYDLYINNYSSYTSPIIYHMTSQPDRFTWSVESWTTTKPTAAFTSKDSGRVSYAITSSSSSSSTIVGDETMTLVPQRGNEVNFGGTNASDRIYIGYRATGSRPIPTAFIFGGSSGTASITASKFIKSGGTSSQFLKADGSIDSNTYVTGGPYLPLAGGDMTGTLNTCASNGTWISGKTYAAIRFNSLTAIDSSSFWRFYNMKSASGNVVCYGGLGDNIGFYGYYSATTENQTDWRFTVNTANGNWTATASIYASHFYENSDINLKKNIKAILDSDNIPVIKEFDWKSDGTHSYGLIAQELEEQGYSELVSDSGSHKTVNYSAALSLIVGKLQNKIKELEKEIENLKLRN